MKKLTAIITTAILCSSVSAVAFAASLINADEAREIAKKQVPATSTYLRTENELNKKVPYYEVKFYDYTTNTEYEIDIFQNSGSIRKYSMETKALFGSSKIVLSANDIQNIILKEYPDAVIRYLELERDNGLYEYEVKFTTPTFRGKMNFNAETGITLEKELKYQY